MKEIAGVELTCREVKNGRVYPTPSYAPSIYRVMLLDDGTFRVTDVITLKDRDGRPLNGMPQCRCAPPPPRRRSTARGKRAAAGPPRHRRRGPGAAGRRHVLGRRRERALARAFFRRRPDDRAPRARRHRRPISPARPTTTIGSLPAIIAKRQANRGIEGIAISPDERFLYFIMQNPLANPDTAAYQQARNTRLFKLERATMQVVGEYVYTLDDPQSFRRDPSTQAERSAHQRTDGDRPRPADRADERTEQTTKLLRDRARRRDQHRRQPLGRRGDAADAGADRSRPRPRSCR